MFSKSKKNTMLHSESLQTTRIFDSSNLTTLKKMRNEFLFYRNFENKLRLKNLIKTCANLRYSDLEKMDDFLSEERTCMVCNHKYTLGCQLGKFGCKTWFGRGPYGKNKFCIHTDGDAMYGVFEIQLIYLLMGWVNVPQLKAIEKVRIVPNERTGNADLLKSTLTLKLVEPTQQQ